MYINDLPEEILRYILVGFCDYDGEDIDEGVFPEFESVRHPVIQMCRNVCRPWRYLIDACTAQERKWQSCTHLRLDVNIFWKGDFVIELARFHRTLISTNDAIVVTFNLEALKSESVDESSTEYTIYLMLFIRGVEMLTPYSDRLHTLRVITTQPKLIKQVLRVLNECSSDSRLHRLHISCSSNSTDASGIWDNESSLSPLKLSFTGTKYTQVEELRLECPTSLLNNEMGRRLTSSLTALNINITGSSQVEVLNFLQSVGNTLRSLNFSALDAGQSTQGTALDVKPIKLLYVWDLSFSNLDVITLEAYSQNVLCPRLERLLYHQTQWAKATEESAYIGDASFMPETKVDDPTLLTAEFQDVYLRNVDMLRCFKYVTVAVEKLSIQFVDFGWDMLGGRGAFYESREVSSVPRDIISRFKPMILEISWVDVDVALLFLKYLDLVNLQQLTIAHVTFKLEEIPESFSVEAPCLDWLVFSGMNDASCRRLIQCLNYPVGQLRVFGLGQGTDSPLRAPDSEDDERTSCASDDLTS